MERCFIESVTSHPHSVTSFAFDARPKLHMAVFLAAIYVSRTEVFQRMDKEEGRRLKNYCIVSLVN